LQRHYLFQQYSLLTLLPLPALHNTLYRHFKKLICMKKQALLLLLLTTLLSMISFANTVVVKGTVKYSNVGVAKDWKVVS
jgi:hypothetical protein